MDTAGKSLEIFIGCNTGIILARPQKLSKKFHRANKFCSRFLCQIWEHLRQPGRIADCGSQIFLVAWRAMGASLFLVRARHENPAAKTEKAMQDGSVVGGAIGVMTYESTTPEYLGCYQLRLER